MGHVSALNTRQDKQGPQSSFGPLPVRFVSVEFRTTMSRYQSDPVRPTANPATSRFSGATLALRSVSRVDGVKKQTLQLSVGLKMKGPLSQPRRGWWRAIVVSTAAVFAAVLLAAPVLAAGTIVLVPSQGATGDTFEISGEGFDTRERVQIRWDGSPCGGPARTDADGAFTVTRTVPADTQLGEHTITAKGLQSGVIAEATFTVIDSVETITTTSSDTTTTTTDTTTTAATKEGASVVVTEFSVEPAEATPGSQIEVEGMLTGKLAKVHLWLDGQRLGTPLTVEKDGSFRATRTIPDLAPGTYWLRLKTPNGKVLVTGTFRVLPAAEGTTTTVPEQGDDADVRASVATPIAVGTLVGILLLIAWAAWWLWKGFSDDEDASGKEGEASRFWEDPVVDDPESTDTTEPPADDSAANGPEDGDPD